MEVDQETVKRQPQLEVRRERRRPLVMPDTFSGDGKFDDWKEHFENVAAVNSWTDDEKLLWLKVRLTGKAQKAFKRLGDADRVDYKKAMKALLERFEPASNISVNCMLPSFKSAERRKPRAGQILLTI